MEYVHVHTNKVMARIETIEKSSIFHVDNPKKCGHML